jgi:carboxyl-terminal processing protease
MRRFLLSVFLFALLIPVRPAAAQNDDLFELRKNFEIFGALYEELSAGYVNDIRPAPFMRAGIEAMLAQLDPYTRFYDEADVSQSRLLQQRNLGGVGITLGRIGGRLAVMAPDGDASAYRTGIRAGDIILQIGETDTEGMGLAEAEELLIGQPGTVVEVLIEREGETSPRSFSLPRVRPRTANVSWYGWLGEDSTEAIAYVRLDQFGERAGREVRRAFRTLNRSIPLQGMVLDLRGNPGGILGEAIQTVASFVPQGSVVVTTRSRADGSVVEYRTEDEPYLLDTPLVILMDRNSASASEIVAGALQDMDRAVVLGEASLGKGLVQTFRPLPHNSTLKLTISHYFLPTGRTIQSARYSSESSTVAIPTLLDFQTPAGRRVRGGRGVEPDVAMDPIEVSPIEQALQQESAFFLFANYWVANRCSSDDGCVEDEDTLLEAFRGWLDGRKMALTTELDLAVGSLEAAAQEAGYDAMSAPIAALRRTLEEEKQRQFESLKASMLRELRHEIRSRLLAEQEMVRADLGDDVWVQRAYELVSEADGVRRLLN